MGTRDIVQDYFDKLKRKNGWDALLGDDMVFTSFASPTKELKGKEAYLQQGKHGRVDLVHVNVPDHDYAGVNKGWKSYYWKPWRKMLARR